MTEYALVNELVYCGPNPDNPLSVNIPDDAIEVEVTYKSSTIKASASAVVNYLVPVGGGDDD